MFRYTCHRINAVIRRGDWMKAGWRLGQLMLIFLTAALPVFAQDSSSQQSIRQIAELKRQVAELTAKLAEKTKSSTLDLQAKCADRAYKDFVEWGYKARDNPDFVGNYNAKLDRCFVQFQHTIAGGFFWRELFDAYSGKEYGEYGWQRDEQKKYWEVPPFVCHVTPLSGEEIFCKSDDEFQELAKVYMGD
jgi:hypothetical protein